MIEPELTDRKVLKPQKRRNVSPIMLSLVIALALALAAGYYVHIKNEKLNKPDTFKTTNEPNHAN